MSLLSNIAGTAIQIGNYASSASTIAQLLTGGGPLVLGSFAFESFEVPESISYGPRVQTGTHLLPGGTKFIDSAAADYREITWSGIFLSNTANSRDATLQALVAQRKAQPLTFADNYFEVVITDLQLTLRGPGRVDYQITCEVQSSTSSSSQTGLLSAIEGDISSALGINLPSALSGVTSTLSTAQSVVQSLSSVTGASPAVMSLLSGLTSANTAITSLSSTANTALSALNGAASGISGADSAIKQISSIASQTGILSGAAQAGSFVSRALTNLKSAV